MMLAGKVALITGAGRGIGRAVALELARSGADIAVCDLRPPEPSGSTAEAVEQAGRRAVFLQADVSDRAAVVNAVDETVSRLGRLDILVNNAAYTVRKPMLELDPADVERVWAVIQWGAFHCSQLAARQMVKQGEGGSIVMISSVHAYRPFPLSTAYNAAKAAINHMAYTWAGELAPKRIRVNVVEPGWTDTPGERGLYTEEFIQQESRKLPLGRLAAPEDIAKAVRYLVSDDGAYVTGTCLRVDGGFVLPR